jgi:hypothetical protein
MQGDHVAGWAAPLARRLARPHPEGRTEPELVSPPGPQARLPPKRGTSRQQARGLTARGRQVTAGRQASPPSGREVTATVAVAAQLPRRTAMEDGS